MHSTALCFVCEHRGRKLMYASSEVVAYTTYIRRRRSGYNVLSFLLCLLSHTHTHRPNETNLAVVEAVKERHRRQRQITCVSSICVIRFVPSLLFGKQFIFKTCVVRLNGRTVGSVPMLFGTGMHRIECDVSQWEKLQIHRI